MIDPVAISGGVFAVLGGMFYCGFAVCHRMVKKESQQLLEENKGLKRLMAPREQSAGGVYRESTVTHHYAEDHDITDTDRCQEKLDRLQRVIDDQRIQLAEGRDKYNDVVDVLYGRKVKPLHTITGARTINKLPPAPTSLPGPGQLVNG